MQSDTNLHVNGLKFYAPLYSHDGADFLYLVVSIRAFLSLVKSIGAVFWLWTLVSFPDTRIPDPGRPQRFVSGGE